MITDLISHLNTSFPIDLKLIFFLYQYLEYLCVRSGVSMQQNSLVNLRGKFILVSFGPQSGTLTHFFLFFQFVELYDGEGIGYVVSSILLLLSIFINGMLQEYHIQHSLANQALCPID